MASLNEINEAGHSYAPGYDTQAGVVKFQQWVAEWVRLNENEQILVVASVVAFLITRELIRAFGTGRRRY